MKATKQEDIDNFWKSVRIDLIRIHVINVEQKPHTWSLFRVKDYPRELVILR